MPRYKLTIEYDGTPFHGWQAQDGLLTAEGVLSHALEQFANHPVTLGCAGRTDAGVHALGQVVHVDIEKPRKAFSIVRGVNIYTLPHPVVLLHAEEVADDFHARFHAKQRHYTYRIKRRGARGALDELRAWHIYKPMDVDAMREGAAHFIGDHDFTSFRSAECTAKSPLKTIQRCDIEEHGEELLVHVSAKSFMHNQVRIMVGSLVQVATGRFAPEKIAQMLAARDRREAGVTAPAHGLYFMGVDY